MATVNQMLVRSNAGHKAALVALTAGIRWPREGAPAAELRGAKVVYATLRKWGCTERSLVSGSQITNLGYQLLNAMEAGTGTCALDGEGKHALWASKPKSYTRMEGGPLDGKYLCNVCIENLGGPAR